MSCRASATVRCAVAAFAFVLAAVDAQATATEIAEELDTPFVITPTNVVAAMLDLADVRNGERLLDLGSGDGRIVLAAAQRGATAVGVELDANLVERSRASARRLNLEHRATFVAQDLFDADYSGYDVVTLYLLPDVNRRLAPRLLALKAGTRIVSHDYGLGDWPPDRTLVIDAPDKPVNVVKKSTLYYWRVPARAHGRWQGEAEGKPLVLDLQQRFQFVSGTLDWLGRTYRITEARIDGTSLAVASTPGASDIALALRFDGDRLAGEVRVDGRAPVRVHARR